MVVFTTIYTVLVAPILMKLGVQNKVLSRSAKVAAIGASTQITLSLLYSLRVGITTVNLVTIPGIVIATFAVSRFLRKAMVIKLGGSVGVALAVILGGAILLIVAMQLLFSV